LFEFRVISRFARGNNWR